jgi:hypothetical protein
MLGPRTMSPNPACAPDLRLFGMGIGRRVQVVQQLRTRKIQNQLPTPLPASNLHDIPVGDSRFLQGKNRQNRLVPPRFELGTLA